MSPRKTPIIARKGNRCAIGANGAVARYLYSLDGAQCQGCPEKDSVVLRGPIGDIVRSLAGASATGGACAWLGRRLTTSQRARYKIEALFAELKQRMRHAPGATAATVECCGAILVGSYRPELETTGVIPR